MRFNQNDDEIRLRPGNDVTLLYVDLQRVQDRNILRDRQLTAISLGLSVTTNGSTNGNEPPRSASALLERRMSVTSIAESVDRDEFEGDDKPVKPATVRYHRLDDRMRFANTLVAANPADIIVIDSWPEECLMRSSFPALDEQDEEDSYVTKTAYRPNGGRGTMVAVKRKCLLPEDERHTNVGLIGLERLVKRNWAPTALSQGGCNQAFVHAVDAGPALLSAGKQAVRLAIVSYDCGRGYRFQNNVSEANGTLSKTPAALFSSRLFLNCRSSSFSNNINESSPRLSTVPASRPALDAKPPLLRATRSNSSLGTGYRATNKEPSHTWWRASTGKPTNGTTNGTVVEGSATPTNGTSTPKQRERKNSWIETRAATPMEDAEERIRIAGELKQLKSFIVVTLANQIGDRRRHLERRASETSLDRFNTGQGTNGAVALVVGRFGINSLPLAQSLASCANTPMTNQECQVSVCDNDRCETMAALWWRHKTRPSFFPSSQDQLESTSSSSEDILEKNEQISINDSTAILEYDRNDWLEAEFECRPRMFTLTFQ